MESSLREAGNPRRHAACAPPQPLTPPTETSGAPDFCGATVSIAGGASNKQVTINLTDTDFKRIGVRVIPANSKGAFNISKAQFRLGGSQYRFTLNAVQSNPKGARIILLFAAGAAG